MTAVVPHVTPQVRDGVALWVGDSGESDIDVWFLHAFADSHLCFCGAFAHFKSERIRVVLFDLPGHGASPPRANGLTVEDAVRILVNLIHLVSASRAVVLVAHSMAAIIATKAARMLRSPPMLVISIEGNLTLADAYLSGQAAAFDDAAEFYSSFRSRILEMATRDEALRRFARAVESADAKTLWTLGRSVVDCADPGADFLRLSCPHIYYWDAPSTTANTRSFLARHAIRQRRTDGVGHWPMIDASAQFYSAVEKDVLEAAPPQVVAPGC
jgi:pimeloyl-ACP methyl ester carboxylesterase